jgi:hypothetical protein
VHGGTLSDAEASFASAADNEPDARHGRVHLGRSARTGRYRITQAAVARHASRGRQAGPPSVASASAAGSIDLRRSRHAARRGQQAHDAQKGRQQQAGAVAAARAAAKHRSTTRAHSRARSHTSSRTTTAAAR